MGYQTLVVDRAFYVPQESHLRTNYVFVYQPWIEWNEMNKLTKSLNDIFQVRGKTLGREIQNGSIGRFENRLEAPTLFHILGYVLPAEQVLQELHDVLHLRNLI